MRFSKYEAAGNDFIMLDLTAGGAEPSPELVVRLCDRHRGVGADGVILLMASDAADARMEIINADGSRAEMCGNGARALFLFALDSGFASGESLVLETGAGVRTVTRRSGQAAVFTVGMGRPSWLRADVPMRGDGDAIGAKLELEDRIVTATCVSMGNPHCVVFVDDVLSFPVADLGPRLERHEAFPERTNVEFAQVVDRGRVIARVWERGAGETMACGTGACASLVAANLAGLVEKSAVIQLPGGELEVEWEEEMRLTGPARHVFDGETVG